MIKTKEDPKREQRISMEIVVDCYNSEEQAMGWYYYLEDHLHFPFYACCIDERSISPLRKGDKVEILGMASERECEHEMFVEIPWEERRLAVPLAQLKPAPVANIKTKEAVADWHYWLSRGHEL